jgi:coproporphyrinogen III oxidase-like Fe-S oxidoreductase
MNKNQNKGYKLKKKCFKNRKINKFIDLIANLPTQFQMDIARCIERVLKLAIPNHIVWYAIWGDQKIFKFLLFFAYKIIIKLEFFSLKFL